MSTTWLRDVLPMRRRRDVKLALVQARSLVGNAFTLPDLLIIGAQRCGTSSLFKYLASHPQAYRSLRKEVQFFTRYFHHPLAWYRAHFPLSLVMAGTRARHGATIAYEATPDYLLAPLAAERAAALVPHVRAVALLRDPVSRAFSQYRHMVRLGFETLDFADAIDAEEQRTQSGWRDLREGRPKPDPGVLRYSYLRRGHYAEQLQRWIAALGRDRVLIIESRDLFGSPRRAVDEVLDFNGLPPSDRDSFPNYSYRREGAPEPSDPIDPDLHRQLQEYFAPHDRHLASLLGRKPGWVRDRRQG